MFGTTSFYFTDANDYKSNTSLNSSDDWLSNLKNPGYITPYESYTPTN